MLNYAAIVIAALALLLFIARAKRVAKLEEELGRLRYVEGSLRELRKEMDMKLDLTRHHLASVAAGTRVPEDMILEGKPFADVSADEGQRMVAQEPALFVLDVRTAGEYASGHIPGSRLIPIDQLDTRLGELPDRATPMLVACAAGSRSAAACGLLAERGYTSLYNLRSGMSGWRGAIERG